MAVDNLNPDIPTTDTVNPPSPMPSARRFWQRKWLLPGLLVLVIVVAVAAFYNLRSNASQFRGSSECLSWAKKIEGKNYSEIQSLTCSLSPRKIANSSLTAQYLEYNAAPKDESVCQDSSFTVPPAEEPQFCIFFAGTVVSDGKIYQGLGHKNSSVPLEYDYCYSTRLGLTSNPKPTSHDLYLYQDTIYDRDVFNNVEQETPFGTCVLNGTTLYHPGKSGNTEYVTNVKVDYKGFPKDCDTITLGRLGEESVDCAVLVTIANASLDACHSNKTPILVDGKITGYKTERQLYVGQYTNGDCENGYVQRMAALNQCNAILDAKLKTSCEPKVSQPFEGVKRVTSTL